MLLFPPAQKKCIEDVLASGISTARGSVSHWTDVKLKIVKLKDRIAHAIVAERESPSHIVACNYISCGS